VKTFIKKLVLGSGRRAQKVHLGLYKGLTLSIDPSSEFGLWLGTFEAETNAWLRKAGKLAHTFIDVGAGYGELSVWALSQRNMARVLAYDPKPERWPVFQENLKLNKLSEDSRLQTYHELFLSRQDVERTAQHLLSLPSPVFLKIDVDGGEFVILQGLRGLLQKADFFFLIETHSRELDRDCAELLRSCGYRVDPIARAWWRVFVPERRPAFNQWLAAAPARLLCAV
jgi:hypothetical protein